jgi:GalNAc-alpha-(1->4)-GalNAc-alpha-(1->3)-diNAcBac-PP-undecaprenol alpha-1,4-N-acetyl-D-galactosaminyltransferase
MDDRRFNPIHMKKLCLVLPSLSGGGMERVMSELAWFFVRKKYVETHLILLSRCAKFYTMPPEVVIHEPKFEFNNKLRILHTIRTINYLRQKVKYLKPDAILSFGEMYNSFVLLSTILMKIKIIVSDRSKPDKKWGLLHEWLRKILYIKATGIISQTRYSKDFLKSITKHQNIIVIPNPVMTFKQTNEKKQNIILNVGRLISSKRIDLLLDVFASCKFEDWKLWIIGDGPERRRLEEKSFELGIHNYVTFWGNRKDIETFYSKAKIFAFTSNSEGFPNALLEAMAAGLACISFDCIAGPSDLINDGENGYLIKNGNIKDYLTKLNNLINSPELIEQFSKRSIITTQEFEINKIGNKYFNYLFL